jgi:hypothetical protein
VPAFSDLLDLRTAVVEQVGRPDMVDVFPRLVSLAEASFDRKLRMRDQITGTTLTLVSGTVALPVDFQEIIGVYNANGAEYVQQPLQMAQRSRNFYAIDGSNLTMRGFSGDVIAQYYAAIPTISASMAGTNWLLQRYPGVYLYGAALEAAKWMRDRELASDMAGLLNDEIDQARGDDERARYSRARVRVRGVTP